MRPHVAIVTAVEPVHLEFFSSVAAIADAKTRSEADHKRRKQQARAASKRARAARKRNR